MLVQTLRVREANNRAVILDNTLPAAMHTLSTVTNLD